MALLSATGQKMSLGHAQQMINVKCDICDTEEDVTSHCTECVKNMCIKCKQYHDKFHTDHKIITVFEGRIIQNFITKCKIHNLVFSYYCKDCQTNICDRCRKTTHSRCNLVDIDKHAEMIKALFIKKVEKQREHLPEIDKISDNIKDHLTKFNKIIESQISLVEKETDKRHNDLNVKKLDLIKKLNSQQTSANITLQDHIQTLQDLRTSIDNITTSAKTQTDLVPNAGVLHLVTESSAKLDSTSINTNFDLPNPFKFTPSTLLDQGINPLGSLQNADNTTIIIDTCIELPDTFIDHSDSKSPSLVHSAIHPAPSVPSPSLRHDISVIREFLLDDAVVSCTSDHSSCWVGLFSDTVKLYNQLGDQLLSVKLSHGTHYTTLTTAGELLVSGCDTTVISRVNKSGDVSKFTDICAAGVECVTGLAATQEGNVFVCARMSGNTKDKVVMFSRGTKILELNSHFTSSTLFGIHAVFRRTLCVLDGCGREGGRLVFLDSRGQLVRHIDRRPTELQRGISALAGDKHGYLTIATGQYINVLSWEGTCKRTFHIEGSLGIGGMSVGEDDVLWIGTQTKTWTKKLIVAKYIE